MPCRTTSQKVWPQDFFTTSPSRSRSMSSWPCSNWRWTRRRRPSRKFAGRQEDQLLHFPDFFFYFFGSLGIELGFIRGQLVQQAQKLAGMDTFLVRYFSEHLHGQLVVGGLGQLHVLLGRFVLGGHHETNGSDEFFIREL